MGSVQSRNTLDVFLITPTFTAAYQKFLNGLLGHGCPVLLLAMVESGIGTWNVSLYLKTRLSQTIQYMIISAPQKKCQPDRSPVAYLVGHTSHSSWDCCCRGYCICGLHSIQKENFNSKWLRVYHVGRIFMRLLNSFTDIYILDYGILSGRLESNQQTISYLMEENPCV
ncbi:hypothetical protein F0562_023023 [Nyssa sinensis]|uniref:Uncharacterized protein n=1 Tax=Nyssa sinensis TaxID=561372 RepID=A0A5J5BL45_9ASTE|nr:hypothetical protein F0562_023023 [Nyssa sinensis]